MKSDTEHKHSLTQDPSSCLVNKVIKSLRVVNFQTTILTMDDGSVVEFSVKDCKIGPVETHGLAIILKDN